MKPFAVKWMHKVEEQNRDHDQRELLDPHVLYLEKN